MSLRTKKSTNSALPTISFPEDRDTGFHSPAANTLETVCNGQAFSMPHVFTVSCTGATGSGAVEFSAANPFGYDVIIMSATFDVTTEATAAATVDVGVAANATTGDDTLMDGIDVGSAAATFGSITTIRQKWASDEFLNVYSASGAIDDMVGKLYVVCVKA